MSLPESISVIALRSMIYNTLVRGLEPKLYSLTILRTVLCREFIWGVDKANYYMTMWNAVSWTVNSGI